MCPNTSSNSNSSENVNKEYRPNTLDEDIIDILREGRCNPGYIADKTNQSPQYVNKRLQRLRSAGWITRIRRGLYELKYDPEADTDH